MRCASYGRHEACPASRIEVQIISTTRVGDTGTMQTDFRRACVDFGEGDMTPHTIVGGAQSQTTLTARASARADRRDCSSEA
jgi:hypothetical protein